MIKMKNLIPVFVILLISISFANHLPKPTGYVNDFAGILTDPQMLESELRMYEQNTTIEIAVVTISGLPPDQTLFSYGVELFQEWGIGKKGEDNGILVLINKENVQGNRLRIELGYGVQGYITGAEAGRILDEALPYYESGDYRTATEIILNGLSEELANYVPGYERQTDVLREIVIPNFPIIIFLIIFMVSFALSNRCPYCFGRLKCSGNECACTKCKRKISRRRRYAPVLIGGVGGHGGGFGSGGFGGGGSGGGGAGR